MVGILTSGPRSDLHPAKARPFSGQPLPHEVGQNPLNFKITAHRGQRQSDIIVPRYAPQAKAVDNLVK